ncbi:hypothetical protein RC1_0542 [Rhodospirillum centenum SW]|uniref:Uncharacterized protein n=1 Tax=Rhodospirillum centenum (strain ATCC 51521 / SW) TaxID=414684 RepID=B6IR93_RHOCS|nr:hypothetical protein RC1_0542 [Rhodospirillum centenum SW]
MQPQRPRALAPRGRRGRRRRRGGAHRAGPSGRARPRAPSCRAER